MWTMHSVTAISLTIKCRKKKEVLWQLFQWLRSWGGLTNTDSSLIKISVYPGSWWGQLTIYSSSGGSAFNLILLLMTNKHLHITWSSADNWISVPISPSHRELTITSHPIDHLVKLSFFLSFEKRHILPAWGGWNLHWSSTARNVHPAS